jgi:hypothetical protein
VDERGQRLDEVAWRTFGRNPLLVSGLVLAGANESADIPLSGCASSLPR